MSPVNVSEIPSSFTRLRPLRMTLVRRLVLVSFFSLLTLFRAEAGRYPSTYNWQEYRSGDIIVLAPEGFEEYARYVLDRSELYLDSLEAWYGVRPPMVRLILNPSQDAGTDLATVQPLRVELTLTPAMDKGIRPQAGLFLDRVTGHELTHIVQFSTQAGISKPARWLFGDGVAPLGVSPDWQVEGQAIWTESLFGGGRLNSSWHRMLWRTPLLEGDPWSAAQIAHSGSVQPPIGRAYVAGAFLYDELEREHGGHEAAAKWMRARAAWPTLSGIPFRKAYGSSMPALYKRFLEKSLQLARQRYGDRELITETPLVTPRPATDWRSPVWSGGTLFTRRESYGESYQLVRIGRDGSGDVVADLTYSPHRGMTGFGNGVILCENRRVSGQSEAGEVVLVRIDGEGKRHELSSLPVRGWAPDYSEANGQLAWVVRNAANGAMEVRTARLDGEGEIDGGVDILYSTPLGTLADPVWSPNGKALAFVADEGVGERILLWREGVAGIEELSVAGAAATLDPAWSADGSLWVSADPEGVFDLYELDIESKVAVRRTFVATGAHEAAPGPGGEIAYLQYTSEGFLPLLKTRSEMRCDTTTVESRPAASPASIEYSGEAARVPVRGYNSLRHLAPLFWLPLYDSGSSSGGATLLGRDPLGFVTWRINGWFGDGSGKPEGDITLDFAAHPVELTVNVTHENLYQRASFYNPYTNNVETFGDWLTRLEGSLIAQENFFFDGGGYWRSLTPWIGYVTRERHIYHGFVSPTELAVDAWPIRFHGLRAGIAWSRSRTAALDPVSRSLVSITLDGERAREYDEDLGGETLRLQSRFHHPTGLWRTVGALTLNMQKQTGEISFSRSSLLPVGYDEHDLLVRFKRNQLVARLGGEIHFPLAYPDWGYGQGSFHFNKLRGLLFAQTLFGVNRGNGEWGDGLASYGGELVLEGWAMYEASVNLRAGIAWQAEDEQVVSWVSFNAPFYLITGGGERYQAYSPRGDGEERW